MLITPLAVEVVTSSHQIKASLAVVARVLFFMPAGIVDVDGRYCFRSKSINHLQPS